MENYIKLLIIGIIGFVAGCQEPEEIISSSSSSGINSVTAYFVDDNTDAEFIDSTVTDLSSDIVIEVPYYYPEESDDTASITKMRVVASIDDNCSISPGLGVLDLTQKNYFTFTNGNGEKTQICITGEIKKLSGCSITYFSIPEDESTGRSAITGTIDEDNKTISLVTTEDLSSVNIEYKLSPHATMSPDSTSTFDLNDETQFTVTAQDGTTSTYTVSKSAPDKISYGYNEDSEEELWTLNFTDYGLSYSEDNNASLAAIGNYLIVSMGDGTAPIYFNRITGSKIGSITLGSASGTGCVTNDLNNHLLICDYAASGSTFKIYSTSSVTKSPSLLLSYANATGYSIGSKVSVQGSIDSDAIITASLNGSGSSSFVRWVVSSGVVGSPEVVAMSGIGSWDDDIVCSDVVYATTSSTGGYFTSFYDEDILYYMKGTSASAYLDAQSDGNAWAYNNNCLDVKEFNGASYLAMCSTSFFPQWGLPTQLYLYDVTSMSIFTGNVDSSTALSFSPTITSNNDADGVAATGDVLLVPSTDGYTLNLYYIDNNCNVLGAYQFDCIDN